MPPNRDRTIGFLLGMSGTAYQTAVRALGFTQGAEDVVQDAYANALAHPPQMRSVAETRAWFLRVVTNAARTRQRSTGRRVKREAALRSKATFALREEGLGREAIAALGTAMNELEEEYRLPVSLCHEQGLTKREAAAVLGLPETTLADRVRMGLERLRRRLSTAGFGAVVAVLPTGLTYTAPAVPASLTGRVEALVAQGAVKTGAGAAASASAAAKGGIAMKVIAGVVLAGAVAAGVAVSLPKGGDSLPAYDPTAQTGFKGPEVVSGPDEPQIPGGAFKMERYAFCGMTGNVVDGARESCIAYNYCESVWWMGDNLVFFGDNILNMVLALDGDRLYRFAGSGVRGDRDGPAECAEFSFGVYVSPHPTLVRTDDGNFFLSDPMNGKLKRIFKKPDGRWWVETIAGGGKRRLKTGETANSPFEVDFWGGGPHHVSLRGPKRDHIYLATGKSNWRCTFLMYPDGKVKCLSEGGNKDIPLGIPGEKGLGYSYTWQGGNWASTCWKVSRRDGSRVKVVGYTDAEIKAKEATGWKRPWDGPVDDCCIWTSGGPLRPDGRAIYVIGGDQLYLRRVMNGRMTSLNTKTGKWVESRYARLNPNSIGCMSISRLTWDGWAYMTYAYGNAGMYRARLYEPLKKPEGE